MLHTLGDQPAMKISRVERVLLATGLVLLAVWGGARFHSSVASRAAIARFEGLGETSPSGDVTASLDPVPTIPVDFQLWSPKRISAYEESLGLKTDPALAILRIRKINLEVPVFNGTDDLTLDRGVGRILGTARIGEPGNLGIAGHRDGFFRGLQSVVAGDVIELVRPQHSDEYVVRQIEIVTPDDTSVLKPTAAPTLTLVTCFPFYFVGHAPKRYIVTAEIKSYAARASSTAEEAISAGNDIKK
jgi:sortase A